MSKTESNIPDLEQAIRDFINRPRQQLSLLQDKASWNKLCSALDVIGDADLAVCTYVEGPAETSVGERYLLVYGLLQVLQVQQDAVTAVCEVLGIPQPREIELEKVRKIRSRSVGHPTKGKENKAAVSSFISRATLRKAGFQLITTYDDERRAEFVEVDILALINAQRAALAKTLTAALEKLRADEMAHRMQHRVEKLADIFHPSLGYLIGKIFEACRASVPGPGGEVHVKMVSKITAEFKSALEKRDILQTNELIKDDIRLVEYALDKLHQYFSGDSASSLNPDSAYIFAFFVEAQMSSLKKRAEEIDAEYAEDL